MSNRLTLLKGDSVKVTYTANVEIHEAISFADATELTETVRLAAQESVLRVMNEIFINGRLRAAKVRSIIIDDVEV